MATIRKDWEDELLNIGSGDEISIKELSYLLKDITKFDGDVVFDTTKPGKSAGGHAYPEALNESERTAVLEYLKTL